MPTPAHDLHVQLLASSRCHLSVSWFICADIASKCEELASKCEKIGPELVTFAVAMASVNTCADGSEKITGG
jgi:hypothetical protein